MGHCRAEKAKTHERIVALAAKRFREKGLEGIAVAELMKQAGLTVGGFYKHFGSRDDLVAQAPGSAVGPWKGLVDAAGSGGPPVTYDSLVDTYLSETHRNHPGLGPSNSVRFTEGPWQSWDFVEPYLRKILSFIGIGSVQTVRAEGPLRVLPSMRKVEMRTAGLGCPHGTPRSCL
jgi:Bacterial regulatory proteins, tetR family